MRSPCCPTLSSFSEGLQDYALICAAAQGHLPPFSVYFHLRFDRKMPHVNPLEYRSLSTFVLRNKWEGIGKSSKWVRVNVQCQDWGEGRDKARGGWSGGMGERALNSEAIIKWNMEHALEGTSRISTLHFDGMWDSVEATFINEFIYVWVDGIRPDFATRLARFSLILANCWQGANKGDSGSKLLSVLQAVETNRVMINLFT